MMKYLASFYIIYIFVLIYGVPLVLTSTDNSNYCCQPIYMFYIHKKVSIEEKTWTDRSVLANRNNIVLLDGIERYEILLSMTQWIENILF